MTITMQNYGLTWTDLDGTPRTSGVSYDKRVPNSGRVQSPGPDLIPAHESVAWAGRAAPSGHCIGTSTPPRPARLSTDTISGAPVSREQTMRLPFRGAVCHPWR
jgi:hypothetical protein